MSQVLGVFGLLDFTMLRPVLAWRTFEPYEQFISLIFKFFLGRGKPRILTQQIRGHACTWNLIQQQILTQKNTWTQEGGSSRRTEKTA
jgi:hypothetical protein